MTSQRYGPNYRAPEIREVCEHALRGESLCFVGVAGTGKSNIINFLRENREYKRQYLGNNVDRVHFPDIDAPSWDQTPLGLWSMMLQRLVAVTGHVAPPPQAVSGNNQPNENVVREQLQSQIDAVCQVAGHQLMFVLDDFDDVIRRGPLPLLDQLNTFRHMGNRGQLSYLVFTKKLPDVLGRRHGLNMKRSKFYDLIKPHVYALRLYKDEDALHMLRHLNTQAGDPVSMANLMPLRWLSGGHARLLKILFETCLTDAQNVSSLPGFYAANADVRDECERIFTGLHRHEQDVALRLTRGQATSDDGPVLDHLVRRGLLTSNERPEWFSPLMAEYLLHR